MYYDPKAIDLTDYCPKQLDSRVSRIIDGIEYKMTDDPEGLEFVKKLPKDQQPCWIYHREKPVKLQLEAGMVYHLVGLNVYDKGKKGKVKTLRTHRLFYHLFYDNNNLTDVEGHVLDHKCNCPTRSLDPNLPDTHKCINPHHLIRTDLIENAVNIKKHRDFNIEHDSKVPPPPDLDTSDFVFCVEEDDDDLDAFFTDKSSDYDEQCKKRLDNIEDDEDPFADL